MALATLSIDIVAQIASLQSGLDRAGRLAEKQAAAIQSRFQQLNRIAGTVGTALGSAFAGVTVTGFITSTARAIDALNDVKDATGSSIENLSALEDIARRNGGTLDEVAGVLVKFNDVLKDADGKNGVSEALRRIGVDAQQLKKLDPAEALRRTAVALQQHADDGERARVVQELFGKSIREAGPFLQDLAAAGRLNATVTTEQAAAAEKFNNQLAELQTNAGNAARELVSNLIPALSKWLENLNKGGGLGGAILSRLGLDEQGRLQARSQQLRDEISRTVDTIERMNEELRRDPNNTLLGGRIEKARQKLSALSFEAQQTSRNLKDLADGLAPDGAILAGNPIAPTEEDLRQGRRRSIGPARASTTPAKAPKRAAEFIGAELPEATLAAIKRIEATDVQRIAELRAVLGELLTLPDSPARSEALDAVRNDIESLNPAFEQAAASHQRLAALLEATPTAQLGRTRDDMLFLRDAFDAGRISAEQFAEAATTRLGNVPQEIKPALDAMSELTREFGRNVQDSLGDTIKRTLKGDFDSIADLWRDMLTDMAAQATAAQLGSALFGADYFRGGALGGFFGGIFGSARGNAFDARGRVEAFANGGIVGSPMLFGFGGGRMGLMGEAGPEAVMPLKRGRDGRLGVAAEGGGITIVNNVSAGVSRSEMLSALQLAMQAMRGEVRGALRQAGLA